MSILNKLKKTRIEIRTIVTDRADGSIQYMSWLAYYDGNTAIQFGKVCSEEIDFREVTNENEIESIKTSITKVYNQFMNE